MGSTFEEEIFIGLFWIFKNIQINFISLAYEKEIKINFVKKTAKKMLARVTWNSNESIKKANEKDYLPTWWR